MKAKDFDEKFDEGKSVVNHLDLSKARRPKQELKIVNFDFQLWMILSHRHPEKNDPSCATLSVDAGG